MFGEAKKQETAQAKLQASVKFYLAAFRYSARRQNDKLLLYY